MICNKYQNILKNTMHNFFNKKNNSKIIYVSHDAQAYGAQYLSLHIIKYLHDYFNFKIDIIFLQGGDLLKYFYKYGNVTVLDYFDQNKIIESLLKKGHTCAICNTSVTGLFVAKLKKSGFKVLTLVHEMQSIINRFKLEQHIISINTYSDIIVFPHEKIEKAFSQYVDLISENCKIYPQGIYRRNKLLQNESKINLKKKLKNKYRLSDDTIIFLSVGSIDKRKGFDIFIEVAIAILRYKKNCFFIWIGHGDEDLQQKYYHVIERTKTKKHFLFPGKTFETDLFYAGSDIYLLTSREDPFPSVIFEALDSCLPIIAFKNATGAEELLKKAGANLVDEINIQEFTNQLLSIINNKDELNKLNSNGRKIIEKDYNFHRYVYTLLNFLNISPKKVSVIIPNYNYEKYIEERIKTIINQTYPIYEIIFLDDCSIDNSVKIARKILSTSNIPYRIIKNKKNSGSVFRQWAKGLEIAEGDYIWIAEADDLSENNFLSTVMNKFAEETIISYSQSKQINNEGKIIAKNYINYTNNIDINKWKSDYINCGFDEIKNSLSIKNTIPNISAVVFKKVNISTILNEMIEFKIAGDWFFYVWLLQFGKIAYTSKSLNYHRIHTDSITKSENKVIHYNEIVKMQEYIINKYDLSKNVFEKIENYRREVKKYLGV